MLVGPPDARVASLCTASFLLESSTEFLCVVVAVVDRTHPAEMGLEASAAAGTCVVGRALRTAVLLVLLCHHGSRAQGTPGAGQYTNYGRAGYQHQAPAAPGGQGAAGFQPRGPHQQSSGTGVVFDQSQISGWVPLIIISPDIVAHPTNHFHHGRHEGFTLFSDIKLATNVHLPISFKFSV